MSSNLQALVVHDDAVSGLGIEIRTVDNDPPALSRAIGCTYFDAAYDTDWAVYFNEDQDTSAGRLNLTASRLLADKGFGRPLYGRALFVGLNGSTEIDVPDKIIDLTLAQIPATDSLRIALFRHHKHLFVYDDQGQAVTDLLGVIAQHRTARDLDAIEAYFGIPPTTWVELRVELMDDVSIQLHDRRNDRSYG